MASYRVPPDDLDELRALLDRLGFRFEARPHQRFLARLGRCVVNAYESGAIVTGGDAPPRDVVAWIAQRHAGGVEPAPPVEVAYPHVGTDESGKGDYFGPLVVAGVLLDARSAEDATRWGVRDSKQLSDAQAIALADQIRASLPASAWRILHLAPERYNAMHRETRNVNTILGWAHAQVLAQLAEANPGARVAVVDQFADERVLREALGPTLRAWTIVQTPRGERDVAVAAASILARADFVTGLRALSERHGLALPAGATHVVEAARRFIAKEGRDALDQVAKVHFRTTERL